MNFVESEVLNILGLQVEPTTGRIFDSDKMVFLTFNNNYIYTDTSLIIHKRDIKFDMFGNMKLAEYLFNVLLKKESEENGLYVQMVSFLEDTSSDYIKRALYVRSSAGEFQSKYYYNICLAYINLVYLISGTPMSFELKSFDYTLPQLKAMYGKRARG